MRSVLAVLFFCVALVGCAVAPGGIRPVWTASSPPPASLAAPAGFSITPARALGVARGSGLLSSRNESYIYADSEYYYVQDTFFGKAPYQALIHGVRVDGKTGKIAGR